MRRRRGRRDEEEEEEEERPRAGARRGKAKKDGGLRRELEAVITKPLLLGAQAALVAGAPALYFLKKDVIDAQIDRIFDYFGFRPDEPDLLDRYIRDDNILFPGPFGYNQVMEFQAVAREAEAYNNLMAVELASRANLRELTDVQRARIIAEEKAERRAENERRYPGIRYIPDDQIQLTQVELGLVRSGLLQNVAINRGFSPEALIKQWKKMKGFLIAQADRPAEVSAEQTAWYARELGLARPETVSFPAVVNAANTNAIFSQITAIPYVKIHPSRQIPVLSEEEKRLAGPPHNLTPQQMWERKIMKGVYEVKGNDPERYSFNAIVQLLEKLGRTRDALDYINGQRNEQLQELNEEKHTAHKADLVWFFADSMGQELIQEIEAIPVYGEYVPSSDWKPWRKRAKLAATSILGLGGILGLLGLLRNLDQQ